MIRHAALVVCLTLVAVGTAASQDATPASRRTSIPLQPWVARWDTSYLSGAVLLLLLNAAAAACQVRESAPMAGAAGDCRRYDPVAAKRTFDGRVGSIAFRNAATRPVAVTVYHPDGDGSAELRWTVPPGRVADLGGGFGNDWGIRADTSCVTTLGRLAQWSDGRFALAWRAGALVAGDSADVPRRELRPDEPR